MNACRDMQDWMLDYRLFTTERQEQVRSHAAECPACAEEFAMLQAFDRRFAGLREDAPAGFADRVLCRLRGEEAEDRATHRACSALGVLVAAQLAVMAFMGQGVRTFVAGLDGVAVRALQERIVPGIVAAGQSFLQEVVRVRLPAVPVRVNWLYLVVATVVIVVFALLTIHREDSRHA